jgi:hypothetical protein
MLARSEQEEARIVQVTQGVVVDGEAGEAALLRYLRLRAGA